MLKRELQAELLKMADYFPIVTLLGPRQSGKTTLVQNTFPQKDYVNLENIDDREFASSDPRSFLKKYHDGAIIDEIQRVPTLLSYLQTHVDEHKKMGQFILTGSHQLELHQAVSQSLAGRTAILKLWPLSLRELTTNAISQSLEANILRGGYAALYQSDMAPSKLYSAYTQTYLEKDIRQLTQIKDLIAFQQFMRLCAGRIGCTINASDLAGELGISTPTVQHWFSILEASFLIFRLPPFFNNFGKRIIKSPKLYFTDVGLASYLLGIENESQLERDPLRGALVENLTVIELMKSFFNSGNEPKLYFYRDRNQLEVDVIYQKGHALIPIEIKSSRTFNKQFLKGLEKFKALAGDRVEASYLIYAGEPYRQHDFQIINYQNCSAIIEKND